MGDTTKLTGLEALEARLNEIESGDADEMLEENAAEAKEEEVVESKAEVKEEVAEEEEKDAESEIEAKSEISSEGETEKKEENVYSPNYQYKFQDEFFDFDDRVKSAIKSPEDEEFFRDMYTKSRAMEMYKGRVEEKEKSLSEIEGRYSEIEQKANKSESIVTYFSSILDGINRGDADSVNKLLSLSDVNQNSLKALGEVIATHLEDPNNFNNAIQQNKIQYEQQNVARQKEDYSNMQAEIARERTGLEVQKAITNPEISDLVKYVDDTWGAGTFEKRVWAEGEAMEVQGKNVSLNDIPNIVKNVADWFGKARPASQSQVKDVPQQKIEKRIVENPTHALPNIKGDRGVPTNPIYKDGTGIDGLKGRYKELTGEEW